MPGAIAEDRYHWMPGWTEGHSPGYDLREDQVLCIWASQGRDISEICGLASKRILISGK
jgi:hypothetical protein